MKHRYTMQEQGLPVQSRLSTSFRGLAPGFHGQPSRLAVACAADDGCCLNHAAGR